MAARRKAGHRGQARIALWRSNLLRREDGSVIALQRQCRRARARYLIAESLIHEIDTARSLFGEMEVLASSSAPSATSSHEDVATMVMRTGYGLTVVIDGVLSRPVMRRARRDQVGDAGTRCSVLSGTACCGVRRRGETHTYDRTRCVRRASTIRSSTSPTRPATAASTGRRRWASARDAELVECL
jgi:predicted dehydrogenase